MDVHYIGGMKKKRSTKKKTKRTTKRTTKRGGSHLIAGNIFSDVLSMVGLGKRKKATKKKSTKKKSTKKNTATKKGGSHLIAGKRKKTTKKASKMKVGFKKQRGGNFIDDISNFASSVANNPIVKGVATVAPIIGNLAPLLMGLGKPLTEIAKYKREIKNERNRYRRSLTDHLRATKNQAETQGVPSDQIKKHIQALRKSFMEKEKLYTAMSEHAALQRLNAGQ